jgi:hypothetical protein
MVQEEGDGLPAAVVAVQAAHPGDMKRRPDEVGGSAEEYGRSAGAGFGQGWFPFALEEGSLPPGVSLDGLLGRHGDGRHLAVAQPEGGLEEGAHRGEPAPQAGLLRKDLGGLFGVAWRVVPEILFQGAFVV